MTLSASAQLAGAASRLTDALRRSRSVARRAVHGAPTLIVLTREAVSLNSRVVVVWDRSEARDLEMRARIVEAARRCFRRDGVRKTRIAAVAAEAGMVRQTVYDFVDNRAQLIGLALAARMTEFAGPVKERFHPGGDVAEDLAELLAVMTEVMNTDPECAELAAGLTPQQALRFMSGPDSEAQPVTVDLLAPIYERAARSGLLRAGLTVEEMAAWARNALAPLAQRDDLSPPELRTVIRRFVLPAFLQAT